MLSSRPRMITSSPSVVDSWRSVATTNASSGTGSGMSAPLFLGLEKGLALPVHVLPQNGDHVAPASERVCQPGEVFQILTGEVAEFRAGGKVRGERGKHDVGGAAGLPGAVEVVDEAIPQPLGPAPVHV